MNWIEYMIMAAQHSHNCAELWFRYLRKDIDKCGVTFTKQEVDALCKSQELSPFQRVSLKAAFEEGSPTREYIRNLNRVVRPTKLAELRKKYEHNI